MGRESKRMLVYGDSYANFERFDDGIRSALKEIGIDSQVMSISHTGRNTGLLRKLWDGSAVQADHILLICGVNDVLGRLGVKAYRQSLFGLVDAMRKVTESISILEIPAFDETTPGVTFASRCKRNLSALLHDRDGDRISRYRAVQREAGCHIARTSDFLPAYNPRLFKDRIHFTDEAFADLARHVGAQIAAVVSERSESAQGAGADLQLASA